MLESMNFTCPIELFLFNSRRKTRSCVNDPTRPQLASRCCSLVTMRLHALKWQCTVFITSILSNAEHPQPWKREYANCSRLCFESVTCPLTCYFRELFFFSFHKNEELIVPEFTEPQPVILNSYEDQFLASLQQDNLLEIHKLAGW